MTPEQEQKIVSILEGTTDGMTGRIEDIDPELTEEEMNDIMYSHDYDRCARCGTWMRTSELSENPDDISTDICESCED